MRTLAHLLAWPSCARLFSSSPFAKLTKNLGSIFAPSRRANSRAIITIESLAPRECLSAWPQASKRPLWNLSQSYFLMSSRRSRSSGLSGRRLDAHVQRPVGRPRTPIRPAHHPSATDPAELVCKFYLATLGSPLDGDSTDCVGSQSRANSHPLVKLSSGKLEPSLD